MTSGMIKMRYPLINSKCLGLCLVFLVLHLTCSCSTKEEKIIKYRKSAEQYAEEGKFKEAVIELKNVIQLDPENDEIFYDLGEVYVQLNYETDAFHSFVRATTINPDNLKAQLRVGQILLMGKKTKEARKIATRIIQKAPDNIEAIHLLSSVLIQERNLDLAIKYLKKAARIDPANFKTYIFLAHLYYFKGDLARAEKLYLTALSLDRSSRDTYMELSHLYGTRGEWAKAESLLKKMAQTSGQKTQKLADLAWFYETQENWDQAERVYLEAVSSAPDEHFMPLINLGAYYMRRGAMEKAMEAMDKALKINREDLTVLINAAQVYFENGRLEESEELVDQILEEEKIHVEANYLKGLLYLSRSEFGKALERFDQVIKISTDYAMAYFYRGLCFLEKGGRELSGLELMRIASGFENVELWERQQAKENFLKAVKLDPDLLDARLMLAELYLYDKNLRRARQHIELSAKQAPTHRRVLGLRVRLHLQEGDMKRAEAVAKKILKLDPDNAMNHLRLGLVYDFGKQYAQAIDSFERALEIDPLQTEALEFMVSIYMQDQNMKKAVEVCEKHKRKVKGDPNSLALIEYLEGKIFMSTGNHQKSKQHFKRAVEIDPDITAPYEALAEIYMQEENISQAIAQYEMILKKKPEYLPAYIAIGSIYESQDEMAKAEKYYRKALEIKDDYAPAANNLAFNLAERRIKLDEALNLARLAHKRDPGNPDVLDTMGWVYYLHGSYMMAIAELQDSLALNPDNPLANYHIGWAYYEKKEFKKARAYMAKALALDPDFSGADEARSILGQQ